MRTPNERIEDLEGKVTELQSEVYNLVTTFSSAIHRSLNGLQEAKRISYIEKRLIWENVSKEIEECLTTNRRLSHHLDYRLKEIDRRTNQGG